MLKKLAIVCAAVISVPAFAQVAEPDAATSAGPVAPNQTTAEQPQTDSEPRAASIEQVRLIVEQEFPKFDADGNGELNEAEFGAWMTQLRSASPQPEQNVDPAAWTAAAFKMADTDSSSTINKAEINAFLTRSQ